MKVSNVQFKSINKTSFITMCKYCYNLGPCCSDDCKFIPPSRKQVCSSTCFYQAVCNGKSANCPQDQPLPSGHHASDTCICDGEGNCKQGFSLSEKIKSPKVLSISAGIAILTFVIILISFKSKSMMQYKRLQRRPFRYYPTYHRLV